MQSNLMGELLAVMKKRQLKDNSPIQIKTNIPAKSGKEFSKETSFTPTPKSDKPKQAIPPPPPLKRDLSVKLSNELELNALKSKLESQHKALLLFNDNIKSETKKRQEAEEKFYEIQKLIPKYNLYKEILEEEIDPLFKEYQYAIAEDQFYHFIFDMTHASLDVKTQIGMRKYISEFYEAYKDLNQRILFGSATISPEQYEHLHKESFMNHIFNDLESRVKESLQPSLDKPNFQTESMRSANKKCTEFFLLVLKRIDSLKNTSKLYHLAKNPLSFLAIKYKHFILKEAAVTAENMLKEYIARLSPEDAKKIPRSCEKKDETTAKLFQPAPTDTQSAPSTSIFSEYASYLTTPLGWVLGQSSSS